MPLHNSKYFAGSALLLTVCFGVLQPASANPLTEQTTGQLVSQATVDESAGVRELEGTVVNISGSDRENVTIRTSDGQYRVVTMQVSEQIRNGIRRGEDVYVTLSGDDVLNVSTEPGAYNVAVEDSTVESSRVDDRVVDEETEVVRQEEVVETETRIEREQVTQQPTVQQPPVQQPRPTVQQTRPTPAPAAQPEPIRALW